jgi:predicted outer membrane repeat protein
MMNDQLFTMVFSQVLGLLTSELSRFDRMYFISSFFGGTVFSGNTARVNGGGLYSIGSGYSLLLDGVNFIHNNASSDGGGAYFSGVGYFVSLVDTIFNGNTARVSGGGLYSIGSGYSLLLDGVNFIHNNAISDGGGLYFGGDGFSVSVFDSSFLGNSAFKGSSIFVDGVNYSIILFDCVFSGNWDRFFYLLDFGFYALEKFGYNQEFTWDGLDVLESLLNNAYAKYIFDTLPVSAQNAIMSGMITGGIISTLAGVISALVAIQVGLFAAAVANFGLSGVTFGISVAIGIVLLAAAFALLSVILILSAVMGKTSGTLGHRYRFDGRFNEWVCVLATGGIIAASIVLIGVGFIVAPLLPASLPIVNGIITLLVLGLPNIGLLVLGDYVSKFMDLVYSRLVFAFLFLSNIIGTFEGGVSIIWCLTSLFAKVLVGVLNGVIVGVNLGLLVCLSVNNNPFYMRFFMYFNLIMGLFSSWWINSIKNICDVFMRGLFVVWNVFKSLVALGSTVVIDHSSTTHAYLVMIILSIFTHTIESAVDKKFHSMIQNECIRRGGVIDDDIRNGVGDEGAVANSRVAERLGAVGRWFTKFFARIFGVKVLGLVSRLLRLNSLSSPTELGFLTEFFQVVEIKEYGIFEKFVQSAGIPEDNIFKFIINILRFENICVLLNRSNVNSLYTFVSRLGYDTYNLAALINRPRFNPDRFAALMNTDGFNPYRFAALMNSRRFDPDRLVDLMNTRRLDPDIYAYLMGFNPVRFAALMKTDRLNPDIFTWIRDECS